MTPTCCDRYDCTKDATQFCRGCFGFFCDECAPAHKHRSQWDTERKLEPLAEKEKQQ